MSPAGRLLVRGGHVLTMDAHLGDLPSGDVLVEDGMIVAVAEHGALRPEAAGLDVIDADGAIVLPGLVDGHRHLWQSLLRATAADWSLADYMTQARTLYAGCFDEDAAYLANLLGGLESIAAGITTVVDHSHLQSSPAMTDALVQGLLDSYVGGVFGYALQNVPTHDGGHQDVNRLRELLTRMPDPWHDDNLARVQAKYFADPGQPLRLGVALPEATPYLPQALVEELLTRAGAPGPWLITGHWVESGHAGVLAGLSAGHRWPAHTLLSHGNHIGEPDLVALAAAGVAICTTPDIECGMGIGPLAARRFRALGGAAAVGTDLSSYARADILLQARLLLQAERFSLAQGAVGSPRRVGWTAREALRLATRDGAAALGMADRIGSLTAGKQADLIVVRPDVLNDPGHGDPAAAVLFGTGPAEIEAVLVRGRPVKRDGVLVGVDTADLHRRIRQAAARVRARYDALPHAELAHVWEDLFS